jgi:hypothetical protein
VFNVLWNVAVPPHLSARAIHLASYQSYQSQIIQYHPNKSTIDEAGETLTEKQKVKHAASLRTCDGSASGRYIKEKISPE